jgi:hypothetical protein
MVNGKINGMTQIQATESLSVRQRNYEIGSRQTVAQVKLAKVVLKLRLGVIIYMFR